MSAAAESVATLRVMLHPYAAARGSLPPDALAQLDALVGTALTLTGTTRTGALELALPAPVDEADAVAMAQGACASTAASCGRSRCGRLDHADREGRRRCRPPPGRAASDGAAQGRRHAGVAGAPRAAGSADRDDAHGRAADRQHLGAERLRRPDCGSTGGDRPSCCRRTPTSSTPIRCTARIAHAVPNDPLYPRAVVAPRSAVRHQRRDRLDAAAECRRAWPSPSSTPASCRTPTSSDACCPATTSSPILAAPATATRATRIRATKATGATASADRRRRQLLPRPLRRRADRRQHQQRHRHRRPGRRRQDPSGARARRVRRHVRGRARRHAVGVRRPDRRRARQHRRRPRSST